MRCGISQPFFLGEGYEIFFEDKDLARYEPSLFTDSRFEYVLRAEGLNASLSDGVLTCSSERFYAKGVTAGYVVYLKSETINYLCEVVECIGETQLIVSMLSEDGVSAPIKPNDAGGLEYWVVSYKLLSQELELALSRYFGLRPGNPTSDYSIENVIDDGSLRQAGIFWVLATIFERLSAALIATLDVTTTSSTVVKGKAIHYRTMYEKTKSACVFRVQSSTGGLGVKTFRGGSFALARG